MNIALSKEDRDFAEKAREFFRSELPAEMRERLARGGHPTRDDITGTMKILDEHGVAVPHWPVEWGGKDWTALQRHLWSEEMVMANVPAPLAFNSAMVGPVIANFGSEEQKKRFLPKTANGEIWWSQGFSEPNAGSDLASLKTAAVRDGDEYVVNGQKIWTSGAHLSDAIFMLTRTDPDAPKH
ncbi:MAG TPA: acyl-CoA dehydrogenase family protein, partial [Mycobacteriales bacterium]